MSNITERALGFGFGVLGGLLIALAAFIGLLIGGFDLAMGRLPAAVDAESEALVLAVLGGLGMLFAFLGHRPWADRPVTSGVLLLLIAVLAWATVGPAESVLALVGILFVLLAGVLYLIPPARYTVRRALPA
jgi:hypothetical protein